MPVGDEVSDRSRGLQYRHSQGMKSGPAMLLRTVGRSLHRAVAVNHPCHYSTSPNPGALP
jgi:hypothetical protein